MNIRKDSIVKAASLAMRLVLEVYWPMAPVLLFFGLYVYLLHGKIMFSYVAVGIIWIIFAIIHRHKRGSKEKTRAGD